MPEEISGFIIKHGYFAICILIFIQEIGIPNPVPNEIVLLFSGYLSFVHLLNLPITIVVAVLSDLSATFILYFVFFYFGNSILKNKPSWVPLSVSRLKNIEKNVNDKGLIFIFIGRMTPIIRGYVTVISGLLQIRPKSFLPITIISTLLWCIICIIAGYFLGPSWLAVSKSLLFSHIILFLISVAIILLIIHIIKKGKQKQSN